jgi:spore coat protein U-like protein
MKLKRLIIAAALAGAGLQFPATQAANSTSTFDVTINLTSACSIGSIAAVDFVYTSFGAAATSTGGGFGLTCTSGLVYTTGLVVGTTGATPPGTGTINVTDAQVNLAYVLTAPTGGTGTGASVAKTITGTMAAAQSGTCAGATCSNGTSANKTQTLFINF